MAEETGKSQEQAFNPAHGERELDVVRRALEAMQLTHAEFIAAISYMSPFDTQPMRLLLPKSLLDVWTTAACMPIPHSTPEGQPEMSAGPEHSSNTILLALMEGAAGRLREEVNLHEQVRAQLEEVDAIIKRLERGREEIDSLKEETRSNISELQRMIAA